MEKPRYLGNVMTDFHEIWRDIFVKFSTLGDHVLLRTAALSNWNRKLIRDVNCRHLENFNDVMTHDAADGPIHMKFGVSMQN